MDHLPSSQVLNFAHGIVEPLHHLLGIRQRHGGAEAVMTGGADVDFAR